MRLGAASLKSARAAVFQVQQRAQKMDTRERKKFALDTKKAYRKKGLPKPGPAKKTKLESYADKVCAHARA